MFRSLACFAMAMVVGGFTTAQTFVVDVANGPGTNFTSIATAVATVPDGATLLVRAGSYGPFAISGKSLTILADTGVLVPVTGGPPQAISVQNIAANQAVTIRGIGDANTPSYVNLANCAGAVTLIDVVLGSYFNPLVYILTRGRLDASHCDQLLLQSFASSGGPDTLNACTATLVHCTMTGGYSYWNYYGLPYSVPPTRALELTNSVVTITDSTISGGDNLSGNYSAEAAILLNGGDTRILDGTIASGRLTLTGVAAIVGSGSLRIDPLTVLVTENNHSPYGPGLVPVIQPMPTLAATDAIIPGAITVHLADPIGDLAILLIGFPSTPILVPGITDAFWLDPTAYFFFAVGIAPLSAMEPVPANVGLRGLRIAWQGVTYGTALGMQASNPVVSLLH